MNKNLRNRMLAIASVAVSSVMLLSGFDSALTAGDIIDKSVEASKSLEQFSASMRGIVDMEVSYAAGEQTQSIPINANVDVDLQYILNPFTCGLTGSVSGDASAVGVAGSAGMDTYIVPNDAGELITYARVTGLGDDAWQAVKLSEEQTTLIKDAIEKSLSGDLASLSGEVGMDLEALQNEFKESAVLSPEAVNVAGKDCYELTIPVTGDKIYELLTQLASSNPELGLDESVLSMMSMVVGALRLDIIEDIDVETFRPVCVVYDLSGSDFSLLAQLAAAMTAMSGDESQETPSFELTTNNLNLTITYDYDSTVSIEVPEDALSAPVQDAAAAEEAVGGMLDEVA